MFHSWYLISIFVRICVGLAGPGSLAQDDIGIVLYQDMFESTEHMYKKIFGADFTAIVFPEQDNEYKHKSWLVCE